MGQTLRPDERPAWPDDELLADLAEAAGEDPKVTLSRIMAASSPTELDANRIATTWGFEVEAMQVHLANEVWWDGLPEPRY